MQADKAPTKFRKKPVIIEAMLFDGLNGPLIYKWLDDNNCSVSLRNYEQTIVIDTLEGEMTATKGDYIIRGVQGEFYPCKPDIFKTTYDKIEA